ncbi:acyl-CoA dehydrogenase family protein [Streptomyces sp. NBRC 109706]|uniref:acyl-CoA dehydrogenase family protein n=1 Tax=Streptomyces sp. NBRC 109706 TaxID=1550035 RepID=UPI000781789A|nr:acyl-CoA dehydrogenase family protein [Streptomyces sp. NBRC 109706]
MNITWNKRQLELRERFREVATDLVAVGSDARDRDASFDRELWKELAAADFWRLQVPTGAGGLGKDGWDWLAAMEGLSLGARDLGFLMSVASHSGLIRLLLTAGTPEQQHRWLPGLTSGEVAATGSTEESGGSDIRGLSTRAVPTADGGFVLNGAKAHITNAPVADVVMLAARTDTEPGAFELSLFVTRTDVDGVGSGPGEDLLGLRTSPTGPIAFRDVRVDADAVIGGVGEGLTRLYNTLAYDRILFGIIVGSSLEAQLEPLVRQLETRHAFGAPLSAQQYMQEKVVSLTMAVEGSRALAYRSFGQLEDQHDGYSLSASVTKLFASTGLVGSGLDLVQAFGHSGYESGSAVERNLRDSVAFKIAAGTDEMQKKNIFNHVRRAYRSGELAPGSRGSGT